MQPMQKSSLLFLLAVGLMAGACKKDEQNVDPTDDNEAITTATLSLTNVASPSEVVSGTIENLNTSASFTNATLNLKANTTYNGSISLLDKTKTPTVDATEEIREKTNEHLFVYMYMPSGTTTSAVSVTITDRDTNPSPGPYPVGLTTRMQTGSTAGSGSMHVVLRHQPNSKNGTEQPGTTDLDTSFPVVIK
ncbi:hypothetical protein [Spirosoma rhododendri]|uniref:Type 1 periplasmic binding fold superfamily protein n=1 Tax=Spirosoma rhododendri TaxID=2728024 RepID=A0A7L5DRV1_9BACT|nr:hypothetical protein [Spirosoma rhododendri]QJD79973.1 hypothetical protein HH216_17320 [Spirosoma rhododendri]